MNINSCYVNILRSQTKDPIACEEYIQLLENILNSSSRKRYKKGHAKYVYYEEHHILPKSLFKEYVKIKDNKILLLPREHFEAHQLLLKIFPTQEMSHALWRMACCNGKKIDISPEEYEDIRLKRLDYPGPATNKHPSQQTKNKISSTLKQLWRDNPPYVHSPEQFKKGVQTRRSKGSYIRTEEQKHKTSASIKGRIFINNGVRNKYIYPNELDYFLAQGWVKGKKPLSEEHKKRIGASLHAKRYVRK